MPYVGVDDRGGIQRRPGLGDSTDPVQAIMTKLTAQMKQLALEQAAINTGIGIALAAIPLVGWALGIVFAVVSTILGGYYKNEATKLVAAFQNQLQLMVAQTQNQIQAVQDAAFEAEKQAGIQLALSGQVTASTDCTSAGLNGWQDTVASAIHWLSNPIKQLMPALTFAHREFQDMNDVIARSGVPGLRSIAIELNRADSRVYTDAQRAEAAINLAIAQSTGEAQVAKTKEAIAKATAAATTELAQQLATATDNINSPPFRAQLRCTIAQQILKDPSIADLVSQERSIMNQLAPAAGGPTAAFSGGKSLNAVPALATGAAVLLFAGLGSRP